MVGATPCRVPVRLPAFVALGGHPSGGAAGGGMIGGGVIVRVDPLSHRLIVIECFGSTQQAAPAINFKASNGAPMRIRAAVTESKGAPFAVQEIELG
ncbi:MAG: hypothetical protein ACJ780_13035 [Solirubrobacteraceae bacterium]